MMEDDYDKPRDEKLYLNQVAPPEDQYVKFPIGGKRPQCPICGEYAKRIEPKYAEWAEWSCNCWRSNRA